MKKAHMPLWSDNMKETLPSCSLSPGKKWIECGASTSQRNSTLLTEEAKIESNRKIEVKKKVEQTPFNGKSSSAA